MSNRLGAVNYCASLRPAAGRGLAVALLLLAALLRLAQLPALPPGLNFDEAGSGVAGLDILAGAPRLWWSLGGGQEPLWPYLAALSTWALGHTPLALRLPAAFTGILTVAAVYKLAASLPLAGRRQQWLGLLAGLGLALSGWHLHFSRLGFRAILLPLFSTLAFYFLWRGLAAAGRPGKPRYFVLAALWMALAIYSYLAARLLPLVLLPFFLGLWLGHRFYPGRFPAPAWRGLGVLLLALLLGLLPLLVYFGLHPADFTARAGAVSIFNPAWHQGDLAGTAWRTLAVTLGTFAGLSGDANPLVNLPGRPALPPLLAAFFGLGLLASLARIGSSRGAPAARPAALLLLCWWGVMLLPALLAPEGAPHHLRLLGAAAPACILAAVGLLAVVEFLAGRLGRASKLALALPLAVYAIVGWQAVSDYFYRWPAAVDFTLPFDLYAVRLAGEIAAAPPGVVYVLPMDLRAGQEARHYTLDYLLAARPAAPYVYIPVDEAGAGEQLRRAAQGAAELRVVRWTGDKHHEADAREIITFLLETSARFAGRQSYPVYDVETYLPRPAAVTPPFSLPVPNRPVGAVFDGRLRLEAAFVPPTVAAGDPLPVALAFSPLAPMDVDYKASLRLAGPAGERLAQKDRVLRHNFHQGTSLWPPETVTEYYLLPVPAAAPPGEYTLSLVLYHPDTLAPLVAGGQAEVAIATVRVE